MDTYFRIPVNDKLFTFTYLYVLNPLLGLTDRELEVLAWLVDNTKEGLVTASVRKEVAHELNIANIHTFMSVYKAKGILKQEEDGSMRLSSSVRTPSSRVIIDITNERKEKSKGAVRETTQ